MTTAVSPTFTGRVVLADEDGFEDAVLGRVFNGRRPARRPEAVVFAGNGEDVAAAVRWAKENGWTVAVRSGGHSWAAWSVRSGGLLLDLGGLNQAIYDANTGLVFAGPAIKGGDELDPLLEKHGRFFNGGHCPSVGIGGFLLQGGQGWCTRGWGWAAESVVAVEVVTADGELVLANDKENSDLYWAARGAGPSFPGIVTKFHLQTRPRFKHLAHTVHVYPLHLFDEVMTWLYSVHEAVSPDVEIVAVSVTPPPGPDGALPARVFVVTGVALTDTPEQGRAALEPLTTCPVIDQALERIDARTSSMAEQKAEQERNNPREARYVVDNAWIDGDVAESVKLLRPLFTDLKDESAFTIWFSMGPLRDLPDMAFSMQSPAYVASYYVYDDASDDAGNRQWLNDAFAALQPVTKGQYLGDSDFTNRQLKFMSDENYARLVNIIADRDPDARFARYLCADPGTLNRNHWDR